MLDRACVVDEQFLRKVQSGEFPVSHSATSLADANLDKKTALELFDSQIKSRLLDIVARQLKEKGLSFYTIGSSGHEGNAVLGEVFQTSDMAFLHYRSGGFFIQRAKKLAGIDAVNDILLSLVAAASDPISGGRHKVFGSVPLTIPPQTSTIASHLPKALGAALSITRAKELALDTPLAKNSVIVCSFGDASLNHASAQTTFNACSWISTQNYPLPIVFVCEDNGIGISVPTPKDWVFQTMSARAGIQYLACDGLNMADVYAKANQAAYLARVKKQPVFLHMRCVRLLGHAGSDIESLYRSIDHIECTEADDPLLHSAGIIHQAGWMTLQAMVDLYQDNKALIEAKACEVIVLPKMSSAKAIMATLTPVLTDKQLHLEHIYPLPSQMQREAVFANAYSQLTQPRNMCQMINFALTDLMLQYPNTVLFGEDVGKKGGVYRVSADLQARFSQRRVFDTLLDETTILGTAIGMAHNGFVPIPEIQFLAYLHNAEDQLRGEAATLSYFSSGQYQNPMVIRIAALAYQKGFGGHFHNDNSIAVLRDIPGIIVACPSNGEDAAKMLRTCMYLAQKEGRVVVFLEPIALYMTKDLHNAGDNAWLCQYPPVEECIELGQVGVCGQGDTVILTYANGYYLSRQAAKILEEQHNIKVKIIDLRWLNPLPHAAILQEVVGAKRILIVDEGRESASISEGLITLLVESLNSLPKIKRLVGQDCFIPLGNAWQYLLPSKDGIVEAVIALQSNNKEKENGRFVIP